MKKIALVTGGTGGIGEAICRTLANDGYFIAVNFLNSEEKARTLAHDINGMALKFDVSDKNAVYESVAELANNVGSIDLLVNNAGVSEIELFTKIKSDNADKILQTNLIGTLNCSRAVLPDMINKKSGCIINVSSMWGECGASCEVDYSASKAGVIGFTKALAKEVGPSGIRINCVSPGFILTDMNKNFSEEDLKLIKEEIPIGFFGKPIHVADLISFLASQKAEFITGQVIGVNGGMVI